MKKIFLLMLSYLLITNVYAQGETNIWYVGHNIKMDFSGGKDPKISNGILLNTSNLTESSTVVSDKNGQLLFAVVNNTIYDGGEKEVTSLPNTTWDISQGTMIFPVPDTENKYYLSVLKASSGGSTTPTASYYEITVNGLGENNITVSSTQDLLPNLTEAQAGVPKIGSNSSVTGDYWLVTHEKCNNNFQVFSVTSTGITKTSTQAVGPSLRCDANFPPTYDFIGTMKFNSCYTQMAYVIGGKVHLYDFDAQTGTLTFVNEILTLASDQPYGVEFSSDGSYVYVLTGMDSAHPGKIYAIPTSNEGLGTPKLLGSTGGMRGGHLQLAPDGNIYYAIPESYGLEGKGKIGRITDANNGGKLDNNFYQATNRDFSTVNNNGQWVNMDMPTFMKSYLTNTINITIDGQIPSKSEICNNSTVVLEVNNESENSVFEWKIEDKTYNTATPIHTFSTDGNIPIELTITNQCGLTKKRSFEVNVTKQATVDYIDTEADRCQGTSVGLKVNGNEEHQYVWYDAKEGGNVLGVGNEYVYQGNYPKKVWIEPQGKIYEGVGGESTEDQKISTPKGEFTKFEIVEDLILKSTDISRFSWTSCGSGSISYQIRKDSTTGTIVAEGEQTIQTCGVITIDINKKLDKGIYYLVLSNINGSSISRSFNSYQGPYIGAEGNIKVLSNSDNSFGYDGVFFNFVTQKVLKCNERTEFEITEKCCKPLTVSLGEDESTCESVYEFEPKVNQNKYTYEWIVLEGTGAESPIANVIDNLSVGKNIIVYKAYNSCSTVYDTVTITRIASVSAGDIIVQNQTPNTPLCLDGYTLELKDVQGKGLTFNWTIPDELESSSINQNTISITPKGGVKAGTVSSIGVDVLGECGESVYKEINIEWNTAPDLSTATIKDIAPICVTSKNLQNFEIIGIKGKVDTYNWTAKDGTVSLSIDENTNPVSTNLVEKLTFEETEEQKTIIVNVFAKNACGVSSTISTEFKVDNVPTTATIDNPQLNVCSNEKIVLTGNQPIVGKGIWRQTSTLSSVTISDQNAHNAELSNLSPEQTYTGTWSISNGACPESTANITIVVKSQKECTITGIQDVDNNRITVYPNPFTSSITLENVPSLVERIQVVDVVGNVVESVENPASSLELGASLSTGTYFIYLYSVNGVQVEKVVKLN